MIAAFLTATLLLAPPPQEQKVDPPDPKRVEQAVTELEQAFKKGDAEARTAAIARNAEVLDADVVAWIERGLRDKTDAVRQGAIEALRYMDHPDALEALESTYRRDRKLRKDPEAFAALLRAIGQHGSPSSIELLADDVWSVQDQGVVRARLYSLGHIRDPRSVRALLGEMKAAGRQRIQPHMEDFRLALMVLTGADQGASQDLWIKWWNDHKDGLEVAPEEPALPKRQAQSWAYYWGRGRVDERPRKRTGRGQD
jgi:hypothetical protein